MRGKKKTARKKWPRGNLVLVPREWRGHFFFIAVFFCVTHDVLSERGSVTGSINLTQVHARKVCFFQLVAFALVSKNLSGYVRI